MSRMRPRIGVTVVFLCLLAGAVKTLDPPVRQAPLPPATSRYLRCYGELEVRPPASVWERLTFSWLSSRAGTYSHRGPARSGSG